MRKRTQEIGRLRKTKDMAEDEAMEKDGRRVVERWSARKSGQVHKEQGRTQAHG